MTRKRPSKGEQATPAFADSDTGPNGTYVVPGPVGIAISTGRSQFINGLIRQVREGHVVDRAQVVGMLELIRDWTDAKWADDRRNTIVRDNLAASMTNIRELRSRVAELLGQIGETTTTAHRVATRHGCGQPIGPEDDSEDDVG